MILSGIRQEHSSLDSFVGLQDRRGDPHEGDFLGIPRQVFQRISRIRRAFLVLDPEFLACGDAQLLRFRQEFAFGRKDYIPNDEGRQTRNGQRRCSDDEGLSSEAYRSGPEH